MSTQTKWSVRGFDRKGKPLGDPVYVIAAARDGAIRCATQVRSLLSMPKATTQVAIPWNPELDPGMSLFIARMGVLS